MVAAMHFTVDTETEDVFFCPFCRLCSSGHHDLSLCIIIKGHRGHWQLSQVSNNNPNQVVVTN